MVLKIYFYFYLDYEGIFIYIPEYSARNCHLTEKKKLKYEKREFYCRNLFKFLTVNDAADKKKMRGTVE